MNWQLVSPIADPSLVEMALCLAAIWVLRRIESMNSRTGAREDKNTEELC